MVLQYFIPYYGGKSLAPVVGVRSNLSAYLCAAYIEKRCTCHDTVRGHVAQHTARTRQYDKPVMCEDVFAAIPLREAFPVIRTDDEDELASRIVPSHGFEGMYHIRRTRHTELKVTDLKLTMTPNSELCQSESFRIWHKLHVDLEGILRRDQEPQFLDKSLFNQVLPQLKVPVVDGIKCSAVYACKLKLSDAQCSVRYVVYII